MRPPTSLRANCINRKLSHPEIINYGQLSCQYHQVDSIIRLPEVINSLVHSASAPPNVKFNAIFFGQSEDNFNHYGAYI